MLVIIEKTVKNIILSRVLLKRNGPFDVKSNNNYMFSLI